MTSVLPRIAALDLDGTLLRRDGTLSSYTVDVLRAARDRGIEPLLVTARHVSHVVSVPRLDGLVGVAICCSGAAVHELPSCRLIEAQWLCGIETARWLREIIGTVPGAAYGWVDEKGLVCTENFPGAQAHEVRPTSVVLEPPARLIKAFALDPAAHPAHGRFYELVHQLIGGRAEIGHRSGWFTEILPLGAGKVPALRRYCGERDITAAEVIAFGDSVGDIPMLRWAGNGVAVANAPEAVRAAADIQTGSCDEDGVASVLAGLLDGRPIP